MINIFLPIGSMMKRLVPMRLFHTGYPNMIPKEILLTLL